MPLLPGAGHYCLKVGSMRSWNLMAAHNGRAGSGASRSWRACGGASRAIVPLCHFRRAPIIDMNQTFIIALDDLFTLRSATAEWLLENPDNPNREQALKSLDATSGPFERPVWWKATPGEKA